MNHLLKMTELEKATKTALAAIDRGLWTIATTRQPKRGSNDVDEHHVTESRLDT